MALRTTQKVNARKYQKTGTTGYTMNTIAYLLIGICLCVFLLLSSLNDYLFFDWLVLCAFIVLALTGMHFIGQKQIKRNQN